MNSCLGIFRKGGFFVGAGRDPPLQPRIYQLSNKSKQEFTKRPARNVSCPGKFWSKQKGISDVEEQRTCTACYGGVVSGRVWACLWARGRGGRVVWRSRRDPHPGHRAHGHADRADPHPGRGHPHPDTGANTGGLRRCLDSRCPGSLFVGLDIPDILRGPGLGGTAT